MKHKNWQYAFATTSHVGTMICAVCKKPIASGQYRYREVASGYIVQHRDCSQHDSRWTKLDTDLEQSIVKCKVKLKAYKDFRDEWDEYALNEEIEMLENFIKYHSE